MYFIVLVQPCFLPSRTRRGSQDEVGWGIVGTGLPSRTSRGAAVHGFAQGIRGSYTPEKRGKRKRKDGCLEGGLDGASGVSI